MGCVDIKPNFKSKITVMLKIKVFKFSQSNPIKLLLNFNAYIAEKNVNTFKPGDIKNKLKNKFQ